VIFLIPSTSIVHRPRHTAAPSPFYIHIYTLLARNFPFFFNFQTADTPHEPLSLRCHQLCCGPPWWGSTVVDDSFAVGPSQK
jgi:hypothetical protein